MPAKIFISVDLPAPFSPISAWTSPGISSKRAPDSARTPGNDLWMSLASTSSMARLTDGDAARFDGTPAPAGNVRLPLFVRTALRLFILACLVDQRFLLANNIFTNKNGKFLIARRRRNQ